MSSPSINIPRTRMAQVFMIVKGNHNVRCLLKRNEEDKEPLLDTNDMETYDIHEIRGLLDFYSIELTCLDQVTHQFFSTNSPFYTSLINCLMKGFISVGDNHSTVPLTEDDVIGYPTYDYPFLIIGKNGIFPL